MKKQPKKGFRRTKNGEERVLANREGRGRFGLVGTLSSYDARYFYNIIIKKNISSKLVANLLTG